MVSSCARRLSYRWVQMRALFTDGALHRQNARYRAQNADQTDMKMTTASAQFPPTKPVAGVRFPSTDDATDSSEDIKFKEQVVQVNEWWTSPRFDGIRRTYSAEVVVSKRGTLQQSYPSSLMAKKLFSLLEGKSAKGEPVTSCQSSTQPVTRFTKAGTRYRDLWC